MKKVSESLHERLRRPGHLRRQPRCGGAITSATDIPTPSPDSHAPTGEEPNFIRIPYAATQFQSRNDRPRNRILLADDDVLVRGSLAAVLESEGYVVDEAADGREAVALAIRNKPNLVLLDLNMPNWDGWTAFSRLDRISPLLPVIVITARPNQYPKAVQLGVDAFMEKPLNLPILMNAIRHFTQEDERRHVRRITNRTFVTRLLGASDN